MNTFIGKRLQEYNTEGSMGVVTDTTFIRCFWPFVDEPIAIFEKGSYGIRVMGPPTPRNIIFPEDTEFLSYAPDAAYLAEVAVKTHVGWDKPILELGDQETLVYLTQYNKALENLPETKEEHETKQVFFKRDKSNQIQELSLEEVLASEDKK